MESGLPPTLVEEFEDLGGGEVDVVDPDVVEGAVHLPTLALNL